MHEVLRNASKNHIRRPNRGGSSRTGFCDRLEHGGYVPKSRKAEDGRIDDRYNLVELSTSSYPARTRRNIEQSDGTVIFSLEPCVYGWTLTMFGRLLERDPKANGWIRRRGEEGGEGKSGDWQLNFLG